MIWIGTESATMWEVETLKACKALYENAGQRMKHGRISVFSTEE